MSKWISQSVVVLSVLLLSATAMAQTQRDQIFAHTNPSIKSRVTYMKAHNFSCDKIKTHAPRLCRARNYSTRALRNSDDSLNQGRDLLALESMASERAATCKIDKALLWGDACEASKKMLKATWKDQVDTFISSNAQVLLMMMKGYVKRRKMEAGLRITRNQIKESYNWNAFNAQLGTKHAGYDAYLKKVVNHGKFFEKHELKRIAKHRCPKGKYKNKKFVKELKASAQAYWSDQEHVNATYKVKAIRLTGKPFTSSADDGSKRQTMPAVACIKAVFPNRTACIYYTVTAKRDKYAKVKTWEPWRYQVHRHGDEFPCKNLK